MDLSALSSEQRLYVVIGFLFLLAVALILAIIRGQGIETPWFKIEGAKKDAPPPGPVQLPPISINSPSNSNATVNSNVIFQLPELTQQQVDQISQRAVDSSREVILSEEFVRLYAAAVAEILKMGQVQEEKKGDPLNSDERLRNPHYLAGKKLLDLAAAKGVQHYSSDPILGHVRVARELTRIGIIDDKLTEDITNSEMLANAIRHGQDVGPEQKEALIKLLYSIWERLNSGYGMVPVRSGGDAPS